MSATTRTYSTAQIRELERLAIEELGIPGYELMSRAGTAAFLLLRQEWPETENLIVVCGPGNNGGDGFIVAGLAGEAGMEVNVFTCSDTGSGKPDAVQAREFAQSRGIAITPLADTKFPVASGTGTVLVDALLGTGLSGKIREPYIEAICWMNKSGLPILALDVPSGLNSDSGETGAVCVKADATITFIGIKTGLTLADGPKACGKLVIDKLELPAEIYQEIC